MDRESGSVRVVRVVTAFECGAIVNPNGLRNQVIGANIMGLGGALFEAMFWRTGGFRTRTLRSIAYRDFAMYRRLPCCRSEGYLLAGKVGETPIVGIAPAIGNAIFDACGVRLRALPMVRTAGRR